jgi:hypothetical protein
MFCYGVIIVTRYYLGTAEKTERVVDGTASDTNRAHAEIKKPAISQAFEILARRTG